MERQPARGHCPECAFKVWSPGHQQRILQEWFDRGWVITDIRLAVSRQKEFEIITLKKSDESIEIYFDVSDMFGLI